ncbi:MAG: Membrane-bound lytic murein transglycosylase B [Alphaproteobacteria bacterium MarineAlpha3_Bin6]|nr:MAG: Membrane-bound lytic murein transglycosylase B [Alphaproteobacteria bacterium MarineAlpha3_Bin6]
MKKLKFLAAMTPGITVAVCLSTSVVAQTVDIADWLEALKAEVIEKEIRVSTFEQALSNFKPIQRVIDLDRRQPEFTLTFDQYLRRVVPKQRVIRGRGKLTKHKMLLNEIGKKYGVQPRFIVSLWGVETDFGRIDGGFPVIHALATLAIDGRRSKFFRGQLITAIRILDQGHITLDKMQGSWAGAMGYFQFMPSSFVSFAIDYDNDGKRDIWQNKKDAFASAANYLSKSGWRNDQTWGREVRIPKGFDKKLVGLKIRKDISEWRNLGVLRVDGGALPKRNLMGSIVMLNGPNSRVFLTYSNYQTILKWNRSNFFAVAVGTLAEKIGRK